MKLRPMATKVDIAGSTILRERPLDEILEACRRDTVRVENLVVHGPSGSGKTTLLTQSNDILRLVTPRRSSTATSTGPKTVPDLFRDVQDQLTTRIPGLPRCHFPRLDLALTALHNDFTPITDYTRHWPDLVRRWRRRPRFDRVHRRGRRNGEAPTVNVAVEVNLLFVKFQVGAVRPVSSGTDFAAMEDRPGSWSGGLRTARGVRLSIPTPSTSSASAPSTTRRRAGWRRPVATSGLFTRFSPTCAKATGADQYRRVIFLDDVDALKQPAGKGGETAGAVSIRALVTDAQGHRPNPVVAGQ